MKKYNVLKTVCAIWSTVSILIFCGSDIETESALASMLLCIIGLLNIAIPGLIVVGLEQIRVDNLRPYADKYLKEHPEAAGDEELLDTIEILGLQEVRK